MAKETFEGDKIRAARWLGFAKAKLQALKDQLRLGGGGLKALTRWYRLENEVLIMVSSIVGNDEIWIRAKNPYKIVVAGETYHGTGTVAWDPVFTRQWTIDYHDVLSGAVRKRSQFGSFSEMYPTVPPTPNITSKLYMSNGAFFTVYTGYYIAGLHSIWKVERRSVSGEILWTVERPDLNPAICVLVAVLGDAVYLLGFYESTTYCRVIEKRNLEDGTLIWSTVTPGFNYPTLSVSAIRIGEHDALFIAEATDNGLSTDWTVTRIDGESGSVVWSQQLTDAAGFAMYIHASGEGIYVAGYHGTTVYSPSHWEYNVRLEKRNTETGDLLWANPVGPVSPPEPETIKHPVSDGRYVYAIHIAGQSPNDTCALWKRDRETGQIGSDGWTTPLSADDDYRALKEHRGFLYLCGLVAINFSGAGIPVFPYDWFVEMRKKSNGELVWRKVSKADTYGGARMLEIMR